MPATRKSTECPFTVLCDTREQAPFAFAAIDGFEVIPKRFTTLPTGDYSIAGYQNRITIERKSVADFYHSIGSDRERFEREMLRLAEMEFAAVVIEGMVEDRPEVVQMGVKSATHTILSWGIQYGVHFLECRHGRREAELKTFHLLRHFWNQEQRRLKARAKLLDEVISSVG